MTPMMMNPNLQIVQNKDYLVVITEMIHDARIVRVGDEHYDFNIPSWMGDPVAEWEGDTLVVHSISAQNNRRQGRFRYQRSLNLLSATFS